MVDKLSFKEYCLAKEFLRLAVDDVPCVKERYTLTKYCKFPVIVEDECEKAYISFKPKDCIEIVWEYLDPKAPSAKLVSVFTEGKDESIHPSWGNTKLSTWLKKHTKIDK